MRSHHRIDSVRSARYGHAAGNISSIATVCRTWRPSCAANAWRTWPRPLNAHARSGSAICSTFSNSPIRSALYHYLEKDRPLPWIDLEPGGIVRRRSRRSNAASAGTCWCVACRRSMYDSRDEHRRVGRTVPWPKIGRSSRISSSAGAGRDIQ